MGLRHFSGSLVWEARGMVSMKTALPMKAYVLAGGVATVHATGTRRRAGGGVDFYRGAFLHRRFFGLGRWPYYRWYRDLHQETPDCEEAGCRPWQLS